MNNLLQQFFQTLLLTQFILLPLMLFYLISMKKKLNNSFKWHIHRGTSLLLLCLPVLLTLFTLYMTSPKTKPVIAPELDRVTLPAVVREPVKSSVPEQNGVKTTRKTTDAVATENTTPVNNKLINEFRFPPPQNLPQIQNVSEKKFEPLSLLKWLPFISVFLFLKLSLSLLFQYFYEKKITKQSTVTYYDGYPLYTSSRVNSPFSTGIFHKKIYLPLNFDHLEGDSILNHEIAHMEGNHSFWTLAEKAALCINWLNPLIYFYINRGELLKELLADEAAVKSTTTVKYSRLILKELETLNEKNLYLSTGFIRKKIIKERINNLINPTGKKAGKTAKLFAITTFALSLIFTVISGCAHRRTITNPEDNSYIPLAKMISVNEQFSLPGDIEPDLKEGYNHMLQELTLQQAGENRILLNHWREDSIDYVFHTPEGELLSTISVPREYGVYQIPALNSRGELYILFYNREQSTGELKKISPTGKKTLIRKISFNNDEYIREIAVDDYETLYINNLHTVHVYADDNRGDVTDVMSIRDMAVSPGGTLYYIHWENPNRVHSWNSLTEDKESFETPYSNSVLTCHDNSLLVLDSRGIKEYHKGEFKGYLTLREDYPELKHDSLEDYYIISHFVKSKNSFFILSTDLTKQRVFLSQIQLSDTLRKTDDRPVLTVEVNNSVLSTVEAAAALYNTRQEDVRISVKRHYNREVYSASIENQLKNGSGSDIISLTGTDYREYMTKGYLENINNYINNDPFFSKEDYLPALTASEHKGLLPGVAPWFQYSDLSFYTNASLMEKYGYSGSHINLSWDELFTIILKEKDLSENPSDTHPLKIGHYTLNHEYYLPEILKRSNSFMDNGSFEEEKFKSFLNTIKIIMDGDVRESEKKGFKSYKKKDPYFIYNTSEVLPGVRSWEKEQRAEEELIMVYPTLKPRGVAIESSLLGINSTSSHKEEAWDFLKFLLQKEMQQYTGINNIPVSREVMETFVMNYLIYIDDMIDIHSQKTSPLPRTNEYNQRDMDIIFSFLEKCNYEYMAVDKIDIIEEKSRLWLYEDEPMENVIKDLKEILEE